MNQKALGLIARSMSEEEQFWQAFVLNTAGNTDRYSPFKERFKPLRINYRLLIKEMQEILIEEETRNFFL